MATGILNRGIMIFYEIETVIPLGRSKGHVIQETMVITFLLVKI